MHTEIRPSTKQYIDNHPSTFGSWRKLGRVSVLAAALLSACGGGGGGGADPAANKDITGATGFTYSGDFPIGMALASPGALADSSALIAGGLGIDALGVSTTKTLQQGVWASQADAIATGRLDISSSGLLSVSALFDTSPHTNSQCYGPAVVYTNHDDSHTSGTLPSGDVAMWLDTDTSFSPAEPCGTAQLNALAGSEGAQIQQGVLLTSVLRRLVATDPAHQTPTPLAALDLTSRASTLLAPLLSGVTVYSASAGMSADGSEYAYRIVLTRGSGTSAQTIEVNMLHTPTETTLRYYGVLQITLGYLTADATLGCTDQMSSGLYRTARLTSLDYNRQLNLLSVRALSGQYCGNPSLSSSSHMADLANLTLFGELHVTDYLTSTTRGASRGWRQNFSRWIADINMTDLSSDFVYIWQAQPDGSAGSYSRIFAGTHNFDTNTGQRSLALYHGFADDISVSNGALQGMICNYHGPSSTNTVQPLFQYQTINLGSSASAWAAGGANHIQYAPTNSCSATSMAYDSNSDGSITGADVTSNALMNVTLTSNSDVQEEIQAMGFTSTIVLLAVPE
jgi:hypothetical protein